MSAYIVLQFSENLYQCTYLTQGIKTQTIARVRAATQIGSKMARNKSIKEGTKNRSWKGVALERSV